MEEKVVLTRLQHSVMAIQGKFRNLFLSEYLVDFYKPKGNVVCIESNYGRNIDSNYKCNKVQSKRVKRTRRVYKRKTRCENSQFNSQIQFHVRSHTDKSKYYKIKIFRQETFSAPGILKYDMSDIMPSLNELCEYHKDVNLQGDDADDTIYIDDIFPILINFKCRITNEDLSIELKKIIEQLKKYKSDPTERSCIMDILKKSKKFNKKMLKTIGKFIPINRLNMAELKYEPERFPSGITVKFCRPSVRLNHEKDYKAKSTIKIFKSGKINFDAFKCIEEAIDLYNWLNYFVNKYYDYVIYDMNKSSSESDESSSSDNSERNSDISSPDEVESE